VEASFARILGAREFEALRIGLARIADEIDPDGAFGTADEAPEPPSPAPRPARRRSG
jgi:hypothetical protein